MKKVFLLSIILFAIAGCDVNSSKIDAKYMSMEDLTYLQDSRTGLCFAILASGQTFDPDQKWHAMACVPCDSVKNYLSK